MPEASHLYRKRCSGEVRPLKGSNFHSTILCYKYINPPGLKKEKELGIKKSLCKVQPFSILLALEKINLA